VNQVKLRADDWCVFTTKRAKALNMKNNYKQLMSKSPSEPSVFKRSTSHSFRSSFRLTKRFNNVQAISCSSLPSFVPPKAAALLEISLPANSAKVQDLIKMPMKVATIRRRSVWANSSASKIRR
jgi:hypothetical protein